MKPSVVQSHKSRQQISFNAKRVFVVWPLAPAAHPVQCSYWCLVFAAVTLHLQTEAKYASIPQATFIGGGYMCNFSPPCLSIMYSMNDFELNETKKLMEHE